MSFERSVSLRWWALLCDASSDGIEDKGKLLVSE